ncbi:MAG: hypothetical protein ACKPEA_08610 [Planctomycetota bacterium]
MSRLLIIPVALAALAALVGCEKQLFPGDMSPTQLQQRNFNGGGENWNYYDMDDGDNEDPCVDNANYPDMSQPWWNAPGYAQG